MFSKLLANSSTIPLIWSGVHDAGIQMPIPKFTEELNIENIEKN